MKFLFLEAKKLLKQYIYICIAIALSSIYLIFLWKNVHDFTLLFSFLMYLIFIFFFSFLAWTGMKFLIKTKAILFKDKDSLKNIFLYGILGGLLATFLIIILNKLILKLPYENNTFIENSSSIMKIFASLFTGIIDEVILRLFFLPFIYFLLLKFSRIKPPQKLFAIFSIIFVAIIPLLMPLLTADTFTMIRLIILNIVGGVIFGYLFLYKNFWAAVIAHFISDYLLNSIF